MRARNESLSTGLLLACFDAARTRSRGLLLLIDGPSGVVPLARWRAVCDAMTERLMAEHAGAVEFQWYDVADQRDMLAVDAHLDPSGLTRLEADELAHLEGDEIAALFQDAVARMARFEPELFPSAGAAVGGVASGINFLGRESTLARLAERLQAGAAINLVAPRRTGKTSLLRALEHRLPGRARYVNLEDLTTVEACWIRIANGGLHPAGTPHEGDVERSAAERAVADLGSPRVLILDELVWFLRNVASYAVDEGERRTLAAAALRALAGLVDRTGGVVIVANSVDLGEYLADEGFVPNEIPPVFANMERMCLEPLETAPGVLRRLLLGTGLVLEAGNFDWLSAEVDLGLPHPAMTFLVGLAFTLRVRRRLDPGDLERELERFVAETHVFREFSERLNRRAERTPGLRAAVANVLDQICASTAGMLTDDIHASLDRVRETNPRELFLWLQQSFPLRIRDNSVVAGSGLFSRWWRSHKR